MEDENKGETSDECSICLNDKIKHNITTPCRHNFHRYCLGNWIKDNNTCPVCRENIVSDDLRESALSVMKNNNVYDKTFVSLLGYIFNLGTIYKLNIDTIFDNMQVQKIKEPFASILYTYYSLTTQAEKIPIIEKKNIAIYSKYYEDIVIFLPFMYNFLILNNILSVKESLYTTLWCLLDMILCIFSLVLHFYDYNEFIFLFANNGISSKFFRVFSYCDVFYQKYLCIYFYYYN